MNSTDLLGCYDISNVDFRERRTESTCLWFCFILQPTEQLRRALGENVVMKAIEGVKVPMRMARIGSLIAIIRSAIPLCPTGPFGSEYLRLEPVAPQSEVDRKPGRSERISMMSTVDGPSFMVSEPDPQALSEIKQWCNKDPSAAITGNVLTSRTRQESYYARIDEFVCNPQLSRSIDCRSENCIVSLKMLSELCSRSSEGFRRHGSLHQIKKIAPV